MIRNDISSAHSDRTLSFEEAYQINKARAAAAREAYAAEVRASDAAFKLKDAARKAAAKC